MCVGWADISAASAPPTAVQFSGRSTCGVSLSATVWPRSATASTTCARKHIARALRLQEDVLAAGGRLDEAARILDDSAKLA